MVTWSWLKFSATSFRGFCFKTIVSRLVISKYMPPDIYIHVHNTLIYIYIHMYTCTYVVYTNIYTHLYTRKNNPFCWAAGSNNAMWTSGNEEFFRRQASYTQAEEALREECRRERWAHHYSPLAVDGQGRRKGYEIHHWKLTWNQQKHQIEKNKSSKPPFWGSKC